MKVYNDRVELSQYRRDIRAGFIESWGRGIDKIVSGMKQAGLAQPKIEAVDGGVRVTIFRVPNVLKNVPENVPQGVPQGVPQELSAIQRKIYECIRENPKTSRAEIARECGVSLKTVGRRLAEAALR